MANDGALDEYVAFINSVPGASPVDASDVESAAFLAAERDYLNKGLTGRLTDYLDRYPQGASRPTALAYAVTANSTAGNAEATVTYADEPYQRISRQPQCAGGIESQGRGIGRPRQG